MIRLYESKEWLKENVDKGYSVKEIARLAKASEASIRKYLIKFRLNNNNCYIDNTVKEDNNPFVHFLRNCEELKCVLKASIPKEDYMILIDIYLNKPKADANHVIDFEYKYKISIGGV